MTVSAPQADDFDDRTRIRAQPHSEALIVDIDGFEGPLDLLLNLAREQKVDLSRISVLALAEQYLKFIEQARRMRLEVAADYLVMAAWMAYLKSRLLLAGDEEDDEPTGDELAAALAFRLKRLEAMREAAARLVTRNRLGRDVFARGMPQQTVVHRSQVFSASLYDLLKAYAIQRQRTDVQALQVGKRPVWSLSHARQVLERFTGSITGWTRIDSFLLQYLSDPALRRSVLASSFTASLEMVREGALVIKQEQHFSPIYVRATQNGNNAQTAKKTYGDNDHE